MSMKVMFLLVLVLTFVLRPLEGAEWIRSGLTTNGPVWGVRGHLAWAISPAGFRTNEPRGLIRLGYPVLSNGGYDLINFIAIEPVVAGKKSLSELERSRLDGKPGKRIWVDEGTKTVSGVLTNVAAGVEQLTVNLGVESFDNGAIVRLVAQQRSDRPDELELAVYRDARSAHLEECVLTATMGNMARTRLLWLKDEVLSSSALFPNYKGDGFARHELFPLSRLFKTETGDVLVAITTDEADPAAVQPFRWRNFWYYGGSKVTQYWRVPASQITPGLQAVVNGRYTYWGSRRAIPGGIAYENFEMRQPFRDGQRFAFGITARTPEQLGFQSR